MSVGRHSIKTTLERALMWTRLAMLGAFSVFAVPSTAHAANPGETVSNTATIEFTVGGAPQPAINSTTATFMVVPEPTSSTIAFFRHTPSGFGGASQTVRTTRFQDGGGAFQTVTPPTNIAGDLADGEAAVSLSSANVFQAGETAFIEVTDLGRNYDDGAIDTLDITITDSDTGDQEVLRLQETGPATGVFAGYIVLTDQASPTQLDGVLSIADGSTVTARYTDPFDSSDVSTSSALIDPFGVVFDSSTGATIDGVTVTLLTSAGAPASVFSPDGVTAYPNTVVTGGSVTDAGGTTFALAPGEYRFPLVAAGDYRLQITAPNGYVFPSTVSDVALQTLPGAPYALNSGSRGGVFTVTGPGPLQVDIPVDLRRDVFLQKSASESVVGEGDFVKYELTLENGTTDPGADIVIEDRLPRGFRYQSGSLRLDGAKVADPQISGDGRLLNILVGDLASGQTATVTYVAEATIRAPKGDAVNAATAYGPGGFLSNRATAVVQVREELLRSRSYIMGRVSVNACDLDEPWPREITPGVSLAGARIFMETGEFVVTDKDGEYHFQDVEPRPHVVQLDLASLPPGFEPVMCEENNRAAGSAISRFVDPKGGQIERVDFHVRFNGAAAEKAKADAAAKEEEGAGAETASDQDAQEIIDPSSLDVAWLAQQPAEFKLVYPVDGASVATPGVAVGVLQPKGSSVELRLNGREVSGLNGREPLSAAGAPATLRRWGGVDIEAGANRLEAILRDSAGAEIERIEHTIYYVQEAAKATYLPARSTRVADGQTAPVIAVRLTDRGGRPVHKGLQVKVNVEPPYKLAGAQDRIDADPLTATNATEATVAVGADGILPISLEPTFASGFVKLLVTIGDEQEEVRAFLKPGKRDWIVVGIAEGTAGFNRISGNMENYDAAGGEDESFTDGRVAFYAKGAIKGEWLLTIAVDTAKRRGDADERVFETIDPDALYPVYGDASERGHDAESQYPLYLKLEREQFFALFGDYDTGLDQSELGRYERRFSGLKTVYEGEQFSVIAFGAESNQGFVKDEIPSDGTTGPYQLSQSPIVVGSETVRIETRDRFDGSIVVSETPLARFTDYEIDYLTGELYLRAPLASTDVSFNPNFLVIDYSAEQDINRGFTYGGRAAARFLDGKVEIGATYVHEDSASSAEAVTSDLAVADATIQLREDTELRLEAGVSENETTDGDASATAFLAELNHQSERLQAKARFRQEDAGYGVGQTSDETGGIRSYGVSGSYRISERDNEETDDLLPDFGLRTEFSAEREEDLDSDASRTRGEIFLVAENDGGETKLGARAVRDELSDGSVERTDQLIVATEQLFWDNRLRLFATREQTINGGKSEAFPTRTLTGAEFQVTDWMSLIGMYEASQQDDDSGDAVRVGVETQPWEGGRINAYGDRLKGEGGQQLMATVGVGQSLRLDENWSASVGVERQQVLTATSEAVTAEERIFGETRPMENFTLANAGLGYTDEDWSFSTRVEARNGATEDRVTFSIGAYGDVTDAFAVSASARILFRDFEDTGLSQEVDLDLGFAYRPVGGDVIVLNKLTLGHTDDESDLDDSTRSSKIVNNTTLNWRFTPRLEVSANVGGKYTIAEIDGEDYSGASGVVGASARYDLSEMWSIGAQGAALYSENSGQLENSAGLFVGFSPMNNLLLELGYNFMGFDDSDFSDANYTSQGVFVRAKIKFDQNSLSGVLKEFE
ncbi:MAG: hypothetical protein AAF661_11440 [Pseudomonadota bacterium]